MSDADREWEMVLEVSVPGKPRGQGSMSLIRDPRTGRELARYADQVVAHRNLAVGLLVAAWGGREPLAGPVMVRVDAWLPRPAGHWGTGRNADRLRPSAPSVPTTAPDADKIGRLACDALTVAGVWLDDAQAVVVRVAKGYCQGRGAGCTDVQVWA